MRNCIPITDKQRFQHNITPCNDMLQGCPTVGKKIQSFQKVALQHQVQQHHPPPQVQHNPAQVSYINNYFNMPPDTTIMCIMP